MFHVRVLCFSFDFLEQKQDQGQTTKPTQTNNNIFSKNKGQRTNSKYKEQYHHQKRNTFSRNKTKTKDTANNQNTFNVVLVVYIVCFIFVVTECVLRSEFLARALMVWCFVSGVVMYCCSCSLFHIRARGFSFDFFRTKTRSETKNTSKPNTTIETTSKNKGQRTSTKNTEQYQTPKKKHNFADPNKNKKTRRIIKTHLMVF